MPSKNKFGVPGLQFHKSRNSFVFQDPETREQHVLHTKNAKDAIEIAQDMRGNYTGFDTSDFIACFDIYRKAQRAANVFGVTHFTDSMAHVKRALRLLGKCPRPGHFTQRDMLRIHEFYCHSTSEVTAHRYYRIFHAFFSWAVKNGKMTVNPLQRLDIGHPTATRKSKFCTQQQRDVLIEESKSSFVNEFVFRTGFFTGMRIKEIIMLRPSQVTIISKKDLTGFIKMESTTSFKTKNRKLWNIPMHASLVEFYLTLDFRTPYFLAPEKIEWSGKYRFCPRSSFRKVCKDVGLPWVGFHTMRRTFASLLLHAGESEEKVAQWMGISKKTLNSNYAGFHSYHPGINRL